MFNLFRKKKIANSILTNWNIAGVDEFEKICNPDSIQYANADGSKVIYLSVVIISGNDLFATDAYTGEPTIIENVNGWQLKGTKKVSNQILVCVISVVKLDDIVWAKSFFNSINSCKHLN